ncbi:hypothetical protein DFH27DRAFT_267640 [Peziza echinospora]|nr:hypothetical protein DFH27DRAFT_267640 [Peziza echinospora]
MDLELGLEIWELGIWIGMGYWIFGIGYLGLGMGDGFLRKITKKSTKKWGSGLYRDEVSRPPTPPPPTPHPQLLKRGIVYISFSFFFCLSVCACWLALLSIFSFILGIWDFGGVFFLSDFFLLFIHTPT